tara:strand:- start:1367 stop:1819 length:453 start_codon:yes stop_codon:yes gene_type:complete
MESEMKLTTIAEGFADSKAGREEWRTTDQIKQMEIDPPNDPTALYHATTDESKLISGILSPHTSEFGREGFHVFDNDEDAEWYKSNLIAKGYNNAVVVKVSIPIEELVIDTKHSGRCYYARDFQPEYLIAKRQHGGQEAIDSGYKVFGNG